MSPLLSKSSVLALPLAAILLATACVPVAYYEVGEIPPGAVEVQVAPPTPRVEVVAVAPSPNHFWVRGHWQRSGARWVWVPGRFEVRRSGHVWVPGRWVRGPRGRYAYIRGYWRR